MRLNRIYRQGKLILSKSLCEVEFEQDDSHYVGFLCTWFHSMFLLEAEVLISLLSPASNARLILTFFFLYPDLSVQGMYELLSTVTKSISPFFILGH